MKKLVKILMVFVIIFAISIVGVAVAISPNGKISEQDKIRYETSEIQPEEFFTDVILKDMSLSDGAFSGEISVDSKLLRRILKSQADQSENELLKDAAVRIVNDKIQVKIPYKVMGLLDTQIDVDLDVINSGNTIIIPVEKVNLGRIRLPDDFVSKMLMERVNNITYASVKKNRIYFDGLDGNKINIEKIYVKNSRIHIKYSIPLSLHSIVGKVNDVLQNSLNP